MAGLMVRVNAETHAKLRGLARRQGETMQAVLDRAVEAYRRQRFLEEANESFAALRADPKAWADYRTELAEGDVALLDGLDPDEYWTEDGDRVIRAPKKRRRRA